jgi:hypothetical protein
MMPHWVKDAVAWFKTPVKTMMIFAVISAIAIFTPECIQRWAGTYEWTIMHRVLEWAFLLGGTIFVLLSGIEKLWGIGVMRLHLNHLPKDEREILGYYVSNNIRTHAWGATYSAASTLAAEGFLEPLQSHARTLEKGIFYYRVKKWVFRYLVKRPKLIS